jgi:hypothetical protein
LQVRQAEIEDDQVRRVPRGHFQRLGAAGRGVHVVAAHAQVDPQRAENLWFVVHH